METIENFITGWMLTVILCILFLGITAVLLFYMYLVGMSFFENVRELAGWLHTTSREKREIIEKERIEDSMERDGSRSKNHTDKVNTKGFAIYIVRRVYPVKKTQKNK